MGISVEIVLRRSSSPWEVSLSSEAGILNCVWAEKLSWVQASKHVCTCSFLSAFDCECDVTRYCKFLPDFTAMNCNLELQAKISPSSLKSFVVSLFYHSNKNETRTVTEIPPWNFLREWGPDDSSRLTKMTNWNRWQSIETSMYNVLKMYSKRGSN